MKLLCVDIDGVVVLGRAGDGAHWSTDMERHLGINRAALSAHFFKPHWAEIVTGQKPLRPALEDALKQIPNAPSAEDLIEFWFRTDAAPNAPFLSALAAQKGALRCVLATNQEQERSAFLWNDLGLSQYFDAIYSSGDIGAAKPDARFFAAIEEAEGAAPEEIGFLDDSAGNIAAAKARGWRTGHVDKPERAQSFLAEWL